MFDHLAFLGRRYVQIIRDVDEDTWTVWQDQRESGRGFNTVIEWTRTRNGVVEITFEGLRLGDEDTFLSVYYFILEQYQPYFGPASAQMQFDRGLSNAERDREFAKQNESLYRQYLTWGSLKKSLRSNDFADNGDIAKLDVHYRFLSAFVHPLSDTNTLLYGRNHGSAPTYDHYSSELCLLYAIVLAVEELRHFNAMSKQSPTVGIEDWPSVERLCDDAWFASSHLWFPGHPPHSFDRVNEANQRMFRMHRDGQSTRVAINPQSIPDAEIGYYRDPLARIVDLHSTRGEMITNLVYVSPWHRPDAHLR
jgi:hypothetical protein